MRESAAWDKIDIKYTGQPFRKKCWKYLWAIKAHGDPRNAIPIKGKYVHIYQMSRGRMTASADAVLTSKRCIKENTSSYPDYIHPSDHPSFLVLPYPSLRGIQEEEL